MRVAFDRTGIEVDTDPIVARRHGETGSSARPLECHGVDADGLDVAGIPFETIRRLVGRLMGNPRSIAPPNVDARREYGLAPRLETELPGAAVVLHDRKVPTTRGNVDHIALAASGIWLIDATHHVGTIGRRNTGRPWSRRTQLYLDNENHRRLTTGMRWQTTAMRAQLDTIGSGDLPIRAVLCFADSTWGRHTTPFEIGGVLVTPPTTLIEELSSDGPLDSATIDLIARHLDTSLPDTAAGARSTRG